VSKGVPYSSVLLLLTLLSSACASANQTTPPPEIIPADCESSPIAQRPLVDLINDLQRYDYCVRLSAARAIAAMGEEASSAVPALTANLYYDGPWEMRSSAAYALGQIGSESQPAVPVLIAALLADFVHVQSAAASALGRIGDRSAVPALALALQNESPDVAVGAAEAIAILTGQQFPGLGGPGYELNDEGVPLIVVAAQKWWDQQGRQEPWVMP